MNDVLSVDDTSAEGVIRQFRAAGVDEGALAGELQREGAEAFAKSWRELLQCIAAKRTALAA